MFLMQAHFAAAACIFMFPSLFIENVLHELVPVLNEHVVNEQGEFSFPWGCIAYTFSKQDCAPCKGICLDLFALFFCTIMHGD